MTAPLTSARRTDLDLAELRTRAKALGYVLATRCRHCGAALTSMRSLAAHAGPVCRRRHQDEREEAA